jgi:hypothetical protein
MLQRIIELNVLFYICILAHFHRENWELGAYIRTRGTYGRDSIVPQMAGRSQS